MYVIYLNMILKYYLLYLVWNDKLLKVNPFKCNFKFFIYLFIDKMYVILNMILKYYFLERV